MVSAMDVALAWASAPPRTAKIECGTCFRAMQRATDDVANAAWMPTKAARRERSRNPHESVAREEPIPPLTGENLATETAPDLFPASHPTACGPAIDAVLSEAAVLLGQAILTTTRLVSRTTQNRFQWTIVLRSVNLAVVARRVMA